jgi:hypothetical protein
MAESQNVKVTLTSKIYYTQLSVEIIYLNYQTDVDLALTKKKSY